MDNMVWIVGVAALVVFVVVRRMAGEPLRLRRLLVLPVVVTALGAGQIGHIAHVRTIDAIVLAGEALFAVAVGLARGFTVQVFVRDTHIWMRYRWQTVALWVAAAVLRFGMRELGVLAGADARLLSNTLLVMVGLTLIGEACVVGLRAMRTGASFAPEAGRVGGSGGARRRSAGQPPRLFV